MTNGNSEDHAVRKNGCWKKHILKANKRRVLLLYDEQSADEAPSISVLRIHHNCVSSRVGTEANILLEGECFSILVNISRSNQNRSAIWNTACCVPSVTGQQSLRRGTARGRLVFAGPGGSGKRNCLRRLPSCVSRMVVVVAFLACPIPPPDPTPEYHQATLQFSFPSSMRVGDREKSK